MMWYQCAHRLWDYREMRKWQNPAPVCRGANSRTWRALQATAFFTPGLLLPPLQTSVYGLALIILHLQFSCLVTTGTICLVFLIVKITKMIFPLTVSLPAGGGCPLLNPRSTEAQGKFPVHLTRFRIGPFWPSHECFFLLQHSQGASTVKPAGLGCHCTGKRASVFLPVKCYAMAWMYL